jgi:glycosyltransferase involved in cell wall biosynthesis
VAAFDVALQPAVVSYASPLKLFEYMAMGCAIVAPASPNIQEILTDQENALLFTPGDTQAFADAVEKVCQNSQLRKSIGQRAMDTIVTRGFTWENNARRVAELFSQLLHREVPALETPESMEGATTSHRFDL